MKEILNFIKINSKNTGYFYRISSIILFNSGMILKKYINEHTKFNICEEYNYFTKELI